MNGCLLVLIRLATPFLLPPITPLHTIIPVIEWYGQTPEGNIYLPDDKLTVALLMCFGSMQFEAVITAQTLEGSSLSFYL